MVPALGFASSQLLAPLATSLVARFNPRLPATIGGLLTGLGWLFTSFSMQQHQVVISLSLFLGPGLALLNAATTTMLAQYFRKRRPLAESLISSSVGISVASSSLLLHRLAAHHGWYHGLQAVAALSSVSSLLALVYRPAALYHPQRPAILHLQMHMRGLKLHNPKRRRRSPSLASLLRSPTVRFLVLSFLTSSPLLLPFFLLAPTVRLLHIPEPAILCLQVDKHIRVSRSIDYPQVTLGLGSCLGSLLSGLLLSSTCAPPQAPRLLSQVPRLLFIF